MTAQAEANSLELCVIQTSDAVKYRRMLKATSRTAVEYCRLHGFSYDSFVGIKRGFHGAHATFNRMFMLQEMVDRGYRGWVLYMDADAYFYDLGFDLRAYLADKQDRSAIMATIQGETVPWHINAGVLFFNLGHPQAARLIADWKTRYMRVSDEVLQTLVSVWDAENDQTMLYHTLNDNQDIRDTVLFEDAMLFNHKDGRFIRQFLAAFESDVEARTDAIELEVAHVLQGTPAQQPGDVTAEMIVTGLYEKILRRRPDPGGLRAYGDVIRQHGPANGRSIVSNALLESEEYKSLS